MMVMAVHGFPGGARSCVHFMAIGDTHILATAVCILSFIVRFEDWVEVCVCVCVLVLLQQ